MNHGLDRRLPNDPQPYSKYQIVLSTCEFLAELAHRPSHQDCYILIRFVSFEEIKYYIKQI